MTKGYTNISNHILVDIIGFKDVYLKSLYDYINHLSRPTKRDIQFNGSNIPLSPYQVVSSTAHIASVLGINKQRVHRLIKKAIKKKLLSIILVTNKYSIFVLSEKNSVTPESKSVTPDVTQDLSTTQAQTETVENTVNDTVNEKSVTPSYKDKVIIINKYKKEEIIHEQIPKGIDSNESLMSFGNKVFKKKEIPVEIMNHIKSEGERVEARVTEIEENISTEGIFQDVNHSLVDLDQKTPAGFSVAFEVLWDKYPRKLGKKQAYRHFKASVKTKKDYAQICLAMAIALERFVYEQIQLEFMPHGKSWFYNWEDMLDWVAVPKNATLGTGEAKGDYIKTRVEEQARLKELVKIYVR